ncbi:response regulator transcription factor [Phytohabitans sp. ZYX-F-186]|uniref:Response regulator transcription factor n=1 Tax=Phytohabitans maris TaxID=3071409 RepID=A0ABU0Z9E8_9ACTN|nr:response regulator transcription factor [Phytohabitans sp. ZYX-F-186]MDQ7903670.1 response regulator transcription factor [Phytohabitans sp. ZYX-F-186]
MSSILLLRPRLWRQGREPALALAEQITAAARPRSGWWSGLARLDLGYVFADTGHTERGLAELAGQDGHDSLITPYRLALQAAATATTGAVSRADQLAAEALAAARGSGLSHQLGHAHRARAKVLSLSENISEAAAHAAEGAHHFADAGAPVEEALTRQCAAALYARLGAVSQVQVEIGRAKTLYAAAGATWLSAELARDERRLAALAPRGGRRHGDPVAALTGRERQIADLVAGGLTNQQIAERLHLSRKTVEAHISRTFAKLGVQSRVALTLRMTTFDAGRDNDG